MPVPCAALDGGTVETLAAGELELGTLLGVLGVAVGEAEAGACGELVTEAEGACVGVLDPPPPESPPRNEVPCPGWLRTISVSGRPVGGLDDRDESAEQHENGHCPDRDRPPRNGSSSGRPPPWRRRWPIRVGHEAGEPVPRAAQRGEVDRIGDHRQHARDGSADDCAGYTEIRGPHGRGNRGARARHHLGDREVEAVRLAGEIILAFLGVGRRWHDQASISDHARDCEIRFNGLTGRRSLGFDHVRDAPRDLRGL